MVFINSGERKSSSQLNKPTVFDDFEQILLIWYLKVKRLSMYEDT